MFLRHIPLTMCYFIGSILSKYINNHVELKVDGRT
nr:MAG TPA: hypothetical protein [Caudoviricetes sp.]